MIGQRLKVRLDPERRRKLQSLAAAKGEPMSVVVREMIDRVYEEIVRAER